jgi:hypothetical protein
MMVMMVMMPMVVMIVMMVVVMMLHGSRGGWRRSGFLRDGVTGEAERKHGGRNKGLDHGKVFLRLENPSGSSGTIRFSG